MTHNNSRVMLSKSVDDGITWSIASDVTKVKLIPSIELLSEMSSREH